MLSQEDSSEDAAVLNSLNYFRVLILIGRYEEALDLLSAVD